MDTSTPSTPPGPQNETNTTNENLSNAKTPPSTVPIASPSLLGTPSTPTPATPESTTSLPRPSIGPIYSAVYSGVPVYEFLVRDVAVMRRRPDSYLNATQILKVAGLEKGKRTKIIEKEVLTGDHEKVQGGYGKYQGTWVPYERGKELAEQYGVLEILRPLLEYKPPKHDIPYSSSPYTPTKEQAMAALRRQAAKATTPAIQSNAQSDAQTNGDSSLLSNNENENEAPTVTNFEASEPPLTVAEMDEEERHRNVLMAIFLNEDPNQIPDLLSNPSSPDDIDYDVIIDSHGHTALHWAAALARLQVMELLLTRGANVRQLNYEGESALVRAVLVTNNYEAQNFPAVLDLLHETIPSTDKDNRTVFHHISMTSGTKGHAAAAKYYMDCMQQWIAQNVDGNLSTILNIQDKNGDTALNIAARVGNTQLVRQLIEMGASKQIENKIGLKAIDFDPTERIDIDDINDVRLEQIDFFTQPITSTFVNPRRKSKEIVSGIQKLVEEAETEWIEQLRLKDEQLVDLQRQCNTTSRQLVEARRILHYFRQQDKEFDETEEYIKFLEKVLNTEDQDDYAVPRKRQKIEHSNGTTTGLDVLSVISTTTPITKTDVSIPEIEVHLPQNVPSPPSTMNSQPIASTIGVTPVRIQQAQLIANPTTSINTGTLPPSTISIKDSISTSQDINESATHVISSLSNTPFATDAVSTSSSAAHPITFPSSTRVVPTAFSSSMVVPTAFASTTRAVSPSMTSYSTPTNKPPTITITPPPNTTQSSQTIKPLFPTSPVSFTSCVSPIKPLVDMKTENEIRSLQAQINAYSKDEDLLRQEINELKGKSSNAELQCKKIIASCCKTELDKVDDCVEAILQAMESDSADFNFSRIKDLMSRVRCEEMEDTRGQELSGAI
ncbi:10153_t:CDS:2 [Cetraspora pellucida]|uniref:10153_t:CDS:1 n=1 Tax=Cetraspora pellucida TaxID=1433469 RepID=A0A9N9DB64_9GLOM|nr:10153_t:CDS:2 [Cetraspora pellucida]